MTDPQRDSLRDVLRGQLQATLGASYTLKRELGGGGMSRVFVARDAFTEVHRKDSLHAKSDVERFTWRVRLPAERPARRWWGSADYLSNKRDSYVLTPYGGPTTEIRCDLRRPRARRGVVHQLGVVAR